MIGKNWEKFYYNMMRKNLAHLNHDKRT